MDDNRMLEKKYFRGAWVTTITPLDEHNSLMKNTILEHYQYLLKANIKAIVPLSPLGECASLDFSEKVALLRKLGEEGGGMKIIPYISESSIKTALKLIMVAESAGADGLVLAPPYFYRPIKQQELHAFYSKILKTATKPVWIVQNDPYSQIVLTHNTIKKLQQFENFYGLIEYGENIENFIQLRKEFPSLMIVSGTDVSHIQKLHEGGDVCLTWLGNAYPSLFSRLYTQSTNANEAQEAKELQKKIIGLHNVFVQYPQPDAIKYALYQRGFPSMTTRVPLEQLSEDNKSILKTEIGKYLQKSCLLDLLCQD